jgi:uncharacterized protein
VKSLKEYLKPLPVVTEETREFWDGCRNHQLLVQKCVKCHSTQYPPLPMCSNCQSAVSNWIPSNGRGRIYSWIVIHTPIIEAFQEDVPFVVGLVDLEGGGRIVTNIMDCPPNEMKADMEVEVIFVDMNNEWTLPYFKPVHSS